MSGRSHFHLMCQGTTRDLNILRSLYTFNSVPYLDKQLCSRFINLLVKENAQKGQKQYNLTLEAFCNISWLNEVKQQIVCNLCIINTVKLHLSIQQHKYTHIIHGCKNTGKLLLNACLRHLSIYEIMYWNVVIGIFSCCVV